MFKHRSSSLRNRLAAWGAALLLSGSVLGLTNCNKDNDSTSVPTPTPTIKLANDNTLGAHLVDKDGNTLYYFTRDLASTNNCTGGCIPVWPVFYDAKPIVGDGLKAEDFASITTSDGRSQTTYKGWPLYYYAPANTAGQNVREQQGETKGENVNNVWFVAKPNYSVLLARTTVTNKTTSQAALKSFLVDNTGRTLYTFALDRTSPTTQSTNCTGNCIAAWPVYTEAGRVLPSALKASDFGTITRMDGPNGTARQQTTYKGLPLYYYTPDASTRNKIEGEGVNNVWEVAAP